MDDVVRRARQRDLQGYDEAVRRSRGLRSVAELEGRLYMEKASAGLGRSPGLRDLLHYVTNAIYHFASAFARDERGQLIHPCLTGEEWWHMSYQAGWVRLRL